MEQKISEIAGGNSASGADLNPQQKEAVEYDGGPLLIIAGAGTGKTKTLTRRIVRLINSGAPPWRILAVTFTNKAAGEMRKRIEACVPGHGSKVWMHTFHSFGARILRQHAALLNISRDFLIYDEDDQKKLVQIALEEMGRASEKSKAGLYVNLISRAKDDLLDAESYAILSEASDNPSRRVVAQVYKRYQAKLNEAGALDFGDLLLKTVCLLRDKDDIRAYYQEYFLHVLVDEYQDTNHAQYMLTKTLAAKHRNVCVVGDPDQSIYSWRGADIRNIMEFERDFQDAKVVTLEQNYRSTSSILDAADNVIRHNKMRKPKNLFTSKGRGLPVGVEGLPTEGEEARWVARTIRGLMEEEGYSLNDIAVFYRTNAQSRSFEEAFRRFQIPYRMVGNVRFYDRKEVKDILAYARVLCNPADFISLMRILNVPARGIGKTGQEKIVQYAAVNAIPFHEALTREADIPGLTPACRRGIKEFLLLLGSMRTSANPPSRTLQQIMSLTGYWQSLEDEVEKDPEAASRLGNLQELVNAAKEFEERHAGADTLPGLADYLSEVSLLAGGDVSDDSKSSVTLMTVHLAKGLEFPVVFLTGLEEGLFPIGAGNEIEEEMEEERRLCYVGMTRAKEALFLTFAATRRIFGKVYSNLCSRFIFESRLAPETAPKHFAEAAPAHIPEPLPDAALAPDRSHVIAGRKVRHGIYGIGRIIAVAGSGEATKVTVLFKSGSRTFLLRYAPLEML